MGKRFLLIALILALAVLGGTAKVLQTSEPQTEGPAQTGDRAEPASADDPAEADENATPARLFPTRSVVSVRDMSESADCTIFAFRPPARERWRMRSRLTERKPVSAPAQKAARRSAETAAKKRRIAVMRRPPPCAPLRRRSPR